MKAFEQRIKEALADMRALHQQEAFQVIHEGTTVEEARDALDEKYIGILKEHLYLYYQLEMLFFSIESAENMASVRQSSLYKMLVHHQYLEESEELGLSRQDTSNH